MTLPLLISVPHAGTRVPEEAMPHCLLTDRQIIADGDEGAAEIYDIAGEVTAFLTTDIARAIVDLNRPEDDRSADGVVKTHTCFNIPVYAGELSAGLVETLLERYYRPYHMRLTELAATEVVLGIDCHTMLAEGPPIGPGPGVRRPSICLSNADFTCPRHWLRSMADCLQHTFGHEVSLNEPFRGGYITRYHSREMPWLQLELSRAAFMPNAQKRAATLSALRQWCRQFE